ncbi:MAG: hypothetical protein JXM79_04705 [Sedimentisphaerales bacterium]|nr:hypothetical protein [Sedimentisphaerales bacterium]
MEFDEKKPGKVEKDAEAIERLRQLREKLLSDNISTARVAGHNLSWMQEDGLAILKEVLFGDYSRDAKKAAAYGLRSMHGRMKKMATEILNQGLEHRDRTTRDACAKSLAIMKGETPNKTGSGKQRIKEIRAKKGPRTQSPRRRKPSSR